jgi:hypothetical protein
MYAKMQKEQEAFTLAEILSGLKAHRGSMNIVAERCGCQREWVRQVLKGQFTDHNLVVVAAAVWAEQEQEAADKRQQALQQVQQARKAQILATA